MAKLSAEEEAMVARTEAHIKDVGIPNVTVVRGTPHSLSTGGAQGVVEQIEERIHEKGLAPVIDGKQVTIVVNKGVDYTEDPSQARGIVTASRVADDHPAFVSLADSEEDIAARKRAPIVVGAVGPVPGSVTPAFPEDDEADWVARGVDAGGPRVELASRHPVAAKAEKAEVPKVEDAAPKRPAAKPKA